MGTFLFFRFFRFSGQKAALPEPEKQTRSKQKGRNILPLRKPGS